MPGQLVQPRVRIILSSTSANSSGSQPKNRFQAKYRNSKLRFSHAPTPKNAILTSDNITSGHTNPDADTIPRDNRMCLLYRVVLFSNLEFYGEDGTSFFVVFGGGYVLFGDG